MKRKFIFWKKILLLKTLLIAKNLLIKLEKISEEEDHHPDISFGWGYAKVMITTHAIEGLSENDFILAAKIDQIFNA